MRALCISTLKTEGTVYVMHVAKFERSDCRWHAGMQAVIHNDVHESFHTCLACGHSYPMACL